MYNIIILLYMYIYGEREDRGVGNGLSTRKYSSMWSSVFKNRVHYI